MGTRVVPAADKEHAFFRNLFQCVSGKLHPLDACRIIRRADDDEVVVHEIDPFGPKPLCHEFLLEGLGVDHHKINLPIARQIECRSRA